MNKKGFTLIELITVIVLIALVLAIASPNILKFSARANEKALKTKIDNIARVIEQYVENNSNDIVYNCENGNSGCVCSSFSSNGVSYTCIFPIQRVVNLKLYSEPCRNEKTDEVTHQKICVSCSIVDPTDSNNCLESKYFSVTINLGNNTAIATYLE